MKRALIVDDEEHARLYLAAILHELYPEIEIQLAASPTEAILLISQNCANIIFLDVEMPGMSGIEMLKQIRDSIKETPVIFVSSYKRAEFIQNAIRLNAIDYIDKPVDPAELKAAIDKSTVLVPNDETYTEEQRLTLFTEKGEMHFDANEILYFESKGRNAIAHFVNGFQSVVVRCNLKSLESLLPTKIFTRSSRQYIINKQFVKFTSKSNLTVTLLYGCKSIVLQRIYPDFFN